MKKRLLSALLTFCMVLTFIPTAWAVNENSGDTTYGPDDDPICIEIGDKITLNGTEGATHSWTYHAGNGYLNDGMVLTSGEESKDTNQVSFQFTKAGTYSVTHTYREKAGDLLVWSDTFAITVKNGSPTVADLEMYTDYTKTEALPGNVASATFSYVLKYHGTGGFSGVDQSFGSKGSIAMKATVTAANESVRLEPVDQGSKDLPLPVGYYTMRYDNAAGSEAGSSLGKETIYFQVTDFGAVNIGTSGMASNGGKSDVESKNVPAYSTITLNSGVFADVADEDPNPEPSEFVAYVRGQDTYYTQLDEAVEKAPEGDTIELLRDCELTKGFNKTLTFTGTGKITINKQLTSNGEAWMCFGLYDPSRVLTFDGSGVEVEWNSEVGTAPWLMLSLSGTLNVTNGAKVRFTVDSGSTGSRNAIYMNAGSAINVSNGSTFEIYGYATDGKEGQGIQLDQTGAAQVNVTGGSTFLIDGTNRGYVNSPSIYVEGSTFTVRNCTANASNGGTFTAIDSIITYQDNAGHGLSAGQVKIQNSNFTSDHNGYYGVYASSGFSVDSTSTLTVTRNSYSGDFAGLKLTSGVTDGKIEKGAVVAITDNDCSGLSNNGKVVFEEGVDLTITGNNNDKGTTSNGGGVYNSGDSANLTLPSDAVIYNNHAATAGDDIFNNTTATISFGNVGTDWYLDGGEDCEDLIDGWYDDGANSRWEAHNSSALHVDKVTPGSLPNTGLFALKAAHGVLEDDGEQEPSEWEVDVNKTAESLDENNRTDVTLTVGGEQRLDNVAVLFVFDKSTSVDVRKAAENLVDELSMKENTNIKVAAVNFYQEAETQGWADFNSMSEDEKTAFFQFNTTGKGGTNYHAGLLAAQDLLSADEIDGYAVYFITISDGITYIWNEDVYQNGTLEPATVWANLSDPHSAGSATQNGASSWEFKYKAGTGDIQGFEYHYTDSIRGFLKSDSTAQAYKNLFTDGLLYSYNHSLAVGDKAAVIEGDGTTAASGKTAGSATVASIDSNGHAILSTDITAASSTDGYLIAPEAAIYKTAEAFNEILNMMEASGNGSHVYVLSLPEDENQWTSNPYGRELMEYMSGETATTVDNEEISGSTAAETFSDIADEILYAIDSGMVNDIISSYFDLTDKGSIDENTFTLTVGGDPVTDIIVEGNTVSFGTPTDGVYPYVVTYNPGTASVPEQFDWQINVPVETNKPVELTYSLTLVSLPVGTGTIRIPTNEEATLEYTTSTDQTGTETFPIPEVTYKVEAPDNALVISKTVHGTTDANILEQEFEFTVDLEAEGEYTYRFLEGNGESGTISDGGKIDLTSGDSIAIEGIPEGTPYTVTETAVEDFTATVDKSDGAASLAVLLNEEGLSATGTIGVSGPSVVHFINTYNAGYTLTYNATSGGWGTDYAVKTQTETGLSATEDILHTLKYQGAEGDGGAPEHADAVRVNENGENEGPFPVVFIGWAASDAFINDAGQSMNLNSHIFGAGEQFPDIVTEVAIPTVSTVYAVWGYDENGDGTADAQQIVIRPADITIYSGGDGYEGVVTDESGNTVGNTGNMEENSNGLPEPGYYFTLPYRLNQALKAKVDPNGTGPVDLSQHVQLQYQAADENDQNRTWTLELYNAGSPEDSTAYDRYIYRMVSPEGQDPVRLQIMGETIEGDEGYITSDEFEVRLNGIYRAYTMSLYTGSVAADQVKAVVYGTDPSDSITGGTMESDSISLVEGNLVIRGATEDSTTSVIQDAANVTVGDSITAAAEDGTVYHINGSNIPVNGGEIHLFTDSIVDEGTGSQQLEDKAKDSFAVLTDDHIFEYKYLDLVDASNGNAYVEPSQAVTIYWPLDELNVPAGQEIDTSKPIYIVHYEGLDREFDDLATDLGNLTLTNEHIYSTVTGDGYANVTLDEATGNLVFQTSSFSPFAVVYETRDQAVTPNTVTVTFYPGSHGNLSGQTQFKIPVGTGVSSVPSVNEDSDYDFIGWTMNGGTTLYSSSDVRGLTFSNNTTFTAQYEYDNGGGSEPSDHDYYVYYYRNYGATSARNEGYDSGERVTIRDNDWWDRDGYVFEGWNTEPDGSGRDYEPGYEFNIRSDLRLYAQWSRSSDGDGGDGPQLNKDEHIAYVSGTPEGLVKPEDFITREEVATIFFRLLTDESRAEYITEYNPYPDLSPDRWSYYSITTMTNGELMLGRPGGVFEPSAYITRGEFAVVAAQFSNAQYSGPDLFSDISDHWARDYINRAANEGWIAGYPDGSFGPDDYITRAQVMALVNEVLDRAPDADYMLDDMIVWPDNPEGAWYYEDVQEATNSHSYEWRNTQHTSEEWEDFIPMKPFNELVREAFNASR